MFLYFAEKPDVIDHVIETRSWDINDKTQLSRIDIEVGPGGKPGTLLWFAPFGTPNAPSGFHADQQQWEDVGDFWIGWQGDNKPTPEQLERTFLVDGYDQHLNDGHVWKCPTARRYSNGEMVNNLPTIKTFRYGKHGATVKSDYLALWMLSGTVWDQFNGEGLTAEEQFDVCVICLAANYRIGPEECGLLHVFDDLAVVEVIKALLDLDAISDSKKKAQPVNVNG